MVHQWGFFGSISAIRKIWSLTANSRSLQAAALNIRFQGPKVWNSLDKNVKSTSYRKFKENLKRELLSKY